MEHAFLHKLGRVLWRGLVGAIVLLAAYVSFGRLLVAGVSDYQAPILAELNRRLPFSVAADSVSGEWRSFSPELVLSGLQLSFRQQSDVTMVLGEGRVRLDVLRSLVMGSLQVSRVTLDSLTLPLSLEPDGRLRVRGFSGGDAALGDWARALLLNIEQLALDNLHLDVMLPGGEQQQLLLELALRRDGSRRELSGRLQALATGTDVTLLADALGDPFEVDTLEADLYLAAKDADLRALLAWMPTLDPAAQASGSADLQVWLEWRDGRPDLQASLAGRSLQLEATDGSWDFPLDALQVDATVQRDGATWSLYTRDLSLSRGNMALHVPRLQLDVWGDSLRLRGEDVPLGPVSALYAAFPATHPDLAEALRVLDARADLGRVEFSLDDIRAPARGWQLAANFDALSVQSWRGAPGVRSGSGYVRLLPGEGQVVLDSQQLSMDFPTVYDHSLDYDDLYGTIALAWGADSLSLHSGLITARGEEGQSRALFGLSVPFSESRAGVEMDLLVGLQDSSAEHRNKYLPAVLDEHLLAWLRDSLGEGRVNQGAFLWRGSLKSDQAALRTVQLFFDVSGTALNYHPDWPPLGNLEGLVLIDDTNVSVWGDRASLYGSSLSRLSAEAWMTPQQQMRLAVAGELAGEAADGLRLVRESPLSGMTGGVFSDWHLDGALGLQLALEIDLAGEATNPRVEVSAQLDDSVLQITPLDLRVDRLSGAIDYSTAAGFTSRDLGGHLWGVPLTASIGREVPDVAPDEAQALESVRIDLAAGLPAEPLQAWLGVDTTLAEGTLAANATVRVGEQGPPTLEVTSTLEGLALSLPPPLAKPAAEAMPFSMLLELGGERRQLALDLERRLDLALQFGDGWGLLGGAVALQDAAGEVKEGALRVTGHLPALEVSRWQALRGSLGAAVPGAGSRALPVIEVEDLLVGTLALSGLQFRDVLFSARQGEDGGWWVGAETDWLQGTLQLDTGLESGRLQLQYLDIDGLSGLGAGTGEAATGELPRLQVDIETLAKGGQALGDLHFQLRSTPWALRAAGITGEVSGLVLGPDTPGELLWQRGEENATSLSARLDFEDFGATLAGLGYEQILETDGGHFDLALAWPGAPQDIGLAAVSGRLGVEVDGGRFLDAPAGTSGTLRVVSILNLAEIVRRLSLTHMFESGIPFDRVDGEVFFHAGTVEVPSLAVQGASSLFSFSGVSPVEARTLNGELVATLPVASNLPWVAALAAGLPVAAGVYVVSKVFEQQVNRMSSAVYRVEGSWDNPEVRFSRIFDTSGNRQRAPAASRAEEDSGQAGGEG